MHLRTSSLDAIKTVGRVRSKRNLFIYHQLLSVPRVFAVVTFNKGVFNFVANDRVDRYHPRSAPVEPHRARGFDRQVSTFIPNTS
jgi:hypothetical protein